MSATARNQVLSAAHTVGGLLPADMLIRISEGKDVPGAKPVDYGVFGARSVRDEAERHWDYLKGVWRELRAELPLAPPTETPADPMGIAGARWVEPLLAELNFGRVPPVAEGGIAADADGGSGGKVFPISHRWQHVPIHVAAWNHDLDRRPGGAGTVPPQSLVQECLNRTQDHLWAVLTNGRQLRLLRDSNALATAAYVEFDLEAIFDGELFSDFVLLYRLLHASRFEVGEGRAPSSCWLEKWRGEAIDSGTRAVEQLRDQVREALTILGTGFLRHPANARLRENLDVPEFHGALLRLVYRLLFLFVAEERDALHPPLDDYASDADHLAHEKAKERYAAYFSTARLRRHARRRRGTAHGDLYRALRMVLAGVQREDGRPELALPGLGGLFDETEADAPLAGLELSNEALLGAVRHLAQVRDPASRRWRWVNYRDLDAEELGSIYESLLELVPKHSAAERSFELVDLQGNDRKRTGSYYTPTSLIETLLDTTLDPVIDDAVKRGEAKASEAGEPDPADRIVGELLELTVCDPACGSGHFLVAAARRIAKRVAAVRERNPEPTLDAVRHALHEVVARCVYGVDLNPMAVELAKVSLWLEALEPGKPLGFLDAHVKCGNALIGATPALLKGHHPGLDGEKGQIPDEAFIATEGDDKKYAKTLERINTKERAGQESLFDLDETTVKVANTAFGNRLRGITRAPVHYLSDVRNQESEFRAWQESDEYLNRLHVADAWCAAFMWIKSQDAPRPVTQRVFEALQDPEGAGATAETNAEIARLRDQYRFFHWHLEFPDVFSVPDNGAGVAPATGWAGGFDCVLGNPPWDSVELKEQEFFAQRSPEIANVSRAARRKKLIAELGEHPDTRPLYEEYLAAKRKVYAESHFLRRSARVPLTGQGNLNVYSLFAETDRILLGGHGRTGVIVPTGIATDARTQYFFKDLVLNGSIAALYDFENREGLFPAVDSRQKFCVLALVGRGMREPEASLAFFLHDSADLDDPDKLFSLSPEEISLLNPNSGTLPVFRSRRDAEITLGIYKRVPVLVNESATEGNPWNVSFLRMFDMAHDSGLFRTREELDSEGWVLEGNVFARGDERMLPLYEAKMVHFFNHRAADVVKSATAAKRQNQPSYLTIQEIQDPRRAAFPMHWVAGSSVRERLESTSWDKCWILGYCDVTSATNERTSVPGIIPYSAVGHKFLLMLSSRPVNELAGLCACQSSFVYDYTSRQKIGGVSMSFFIWKQLPVLSPGCMGENYRFLSPRVLELTYTAHDMTPFARDLGDDGPPFRWDEGRRAIIRAELDALFFHLYGIERDDVDYIMETFPIVKRKDEAQYGTYRTKDLILEYYDRMAEAGASLDTPLVDGENFTSTLTPPPGHGPRHAPA